MTGGRESATYLCHLREMHLRQARKTKTIVLDATRSADHVSDEMVYRALTHYFDRYETVINGFFLNNPLRLEGGDES